MTVGRRAACPYINYTVMIVEFPPRIELPVPILIPLVPPPSMYILQHILCGDFAASEAKPSAVLTSATIQLIIIQNGQIHLTPPVPPPPPL